MYVTTCRYMYVHVHVRGSCDWEHSGMETGYSIDACP